jgi:alpha-galactosidase
MKYVSIRKAICFLILLLVLLSIQTCQRYESISTIETAAIRMEFNQFLQTRINSKDAETSEFRDVFQSSEYLIVNECVVDSFRFIETEKISVKDKIGSGHRTEITGTAEKNGIIINKKTVVLSYDLYPDMLFTKVIYTNMGSSPIMINKWVNNQYDISALSDNPPFWSFQGASYESRPDWVLPLKAGFTQQNFMGMNASDYGGGIPLVDIWRKDGGLAIGLVEDVPRLVSLPVEMTEDGSFASFGVQYNVNRSLAPSESFSTYNTFVSVHKGDFYQTLRQFSSYMQKRGREIGAPPTTAYEPVWCAWGYERNFNVTEVLSTLPKVKELGYEWAVLDDGWQTAEGDWFLNRIKFPRGDADMIDFVKQINQAGLKAKLWWAPLAVDPGTRLMKEHPDLLLINARGETQDITWWDSYYLCPAFKGTIDYTKELVTKIMKTWGYAGLKIDGQHLNAVPPCYNPAHHHPSPQESVERLPDFFKMIYQTALSINPEAVVEICACGTVGSYYNMPFLNQSVSSDPTSSWQIRLKGKTTKALMGPQAAYYGDHVELSDSGIDFASSVGIGAVIGTKFTWPRDDHPQKGYMLTPDKEEIWKNWTSLYKKHLLPNGNYQGHLYDIGYDRPETHVIEKEDVFYYAFYDSSFEGELTFRGFPEGSYMVINYENEQTIGKINSNNPGLKTKFTDHLLVMLRKE